MEGSEWVRRVILIVIEGRGSLSSTLVCISSSDGEIEIKMGMIIDKIDPIISIRFYKSIRTTTNRSDSINRSDYTN